MSTSRSSAESFDKPGPRQLLIKSPGALTYISMYSHYTRIQKNEKLVNVSQKREGFILPSLVNLKFLKFDLNRLRFHSAKKRNER